MLAKSRSAKLLVDPNSVKRATKLLAMTGEVLKYKFFKIKIKIE